MTSWVWIFAIGIDWELSEPRNTEISEWERDGKEGESGLKGDVALIP